MITEYGRKFIGLFEGSPYGGCEEHIEDYIRDDTRIKRSMVLDHLNSIYSKGFFTSAPTYDVETGERFLAGLCEDGEYTVTTDFIRYYKQGKVDIPKEYEDYLIKQALNA